MEYTNLPFDYVVAEGPEGLSNVLDDFLNHSQHDPEFAAKEHYILYHLGNQKSLISVDMSKRPYQFWYSDLLGRPATNAVKKTIAQFLTEKCGEKELFKEESLGIGE